MARLVFSQDPSVESELDSAPHAHLPERDLASDVYLLRQTKLRQMALRWQERLLRVARLRFVFEIFRV